MIRVQSSNMRIGTPYKQHPGLVEQWDAIVIGSGIGGLSVAATLSKLAAKRGTKPMPEAKTSPASRHASAAAQMHKSASV